MPDSVYNFRMPRPFHSVFFPLGIGLAFAAISAAQTPAQRPPAGPNNACDALKPVTVRIETTREVGAGFVIQTTGRTAIIATAYHVVARANLVPVSFPSANLTATVAYPKAGAQPALDLAFLRAELPVQLNRMTAPGIHSEQLAMGERVGYLGHPGELRWQCYPAKEVVSRLSVQGDDRQFFFTNPNTLRGLSGGPVFDESGRLLGMIIGQSSSSNAIAVRISSIVRILEDEVGVRLDSVSSGNVGAGTRTLPAGGDPAPGPLRSEQRVDADGFVFQLRQCSATRTLVTCKLSITSQKMDRNIHFGDWYGNSSFYDQDGGEYALTGVTIANKHGDRAVETLLVRDLPVQAEVSFKVTADVTGIPLMKLRAGVRETNTFLDIQFRNIRPQP
jgi:hypothetical protein